MGKIKEHLVRHKELYIGIGIGVGVAAIAGVTCAIMKHNNLGKMPLQATELLENAIAGDNSVMIANTGHNSVFNVSVDPGRAVGQMVIDTESNLSYSSIREAADALGLGYRELYNNFDRYPNLIKIATPK